ncbi:MAG TPA: acyl-ACP--UDP-N-acetylglucosamine O-acyltransferase [Bacteroidia bacterium]|nr:acyl-ACP--UDP-N-acetylglucosamine O-acyltransferase [Bacteroidia bacterium]
MSIHPTALVDPNAEIGNDVKIGPFAIVEAGTRIADGCRIEAAAQILRGTEIGEGCRVGSGTILGGDPQFRDFDPEVPSGVRIGRDNVIRENVTVHRSIHPGGTTSVGDGNFLMTGSHIGHDTVVGNGNTFANCVQLAGHVSVGNSCFLGGGAMAHQFVRIGDLVMVQGLAGLSLDLPPYLMAAAGLNWVVGINAVGLKRAGYSQETRTSLKEAFRTIYWGAETLQSVLARVSNEELDPVMSNFYDFLKGESKKGLCIRTYRGARNA